MSNIPHKIQSKRLYKKIRKKSLQFNACVQTHILSIKREYFDD